jgi:hypothetical protein
LTVHFEYHEAGHATVCHRSGRPRAPCRLAGRTGVIGGRLAFRVETLEQKGHVGAGAIGGQYQLHQVLCWKGIEIKGDYEGICCDKSGGRRVSTARTAKK